MSSLSKTEEQVWEGFGRFRSCVGGGLHLLDVCVLCTIDLLLWMACAYALVSRGCYLCSLERLWFPL